MNSEEGREAERVRPVSKESQAEISQPDDTPPEFARAVVIHAAYWTHVPAEHTRLLARGIEFLDWPDRLRLHHLNCMQRLSNEAEIAPAADECQQTQRCLTAADSPYRARPALVWQGP